MKRIYTQNISALASKYPALAKSLDDLAMPSEYQYVAAKNGQPNSKVTRDGKDYYYHSTYDPQKESSKYIQTYYADHEQQCLNAAFAIVIGLGCGYHVFDLINKVTWLRELIIIEPDMALFKTILNHVDLTELISHQKISFVLGDVNLDTFRNLHAAQWLNLGGVIIVPSLFMTNYAKEYLDKVNSLVAEFIQEKDFNARTYIKCGRPMLENQFKNIPFMFSCPPVNELFGKFEGVPCICIASGPSLNDYLEDLKKIRDKAIFICADSAFKVLIENGIKPDIVTAIDPLPGKFKYFEENSHLTKDILLVAGTTTYPGMLTSWQGPIRIMLQGSKQFGFYFEDVAYPCVERFPDFHTVALSSLMIADKLGGNPIVLVGQDLCLGKTDHVQGASIGKRIEILQINGKYYARPLGSFSGNRSIKDVEYVNSLISEYQELRKKWLSTNDDNLLPLLESMWDEVKVILIPKLGYLTYDAFCFFILACSTIVFCNNPEELWNELILKGYINSDGKILIDYDCRIKKNNLDLDAKYSKFISILSNIISYPIIPGEPVLLVKDYFDQNIPTLSTFALYIRAFESYIATANLHVYNLTSRGARINGAIRVSANEIKELLTSYSISGDLITNQVKVLSKITDNATEYITQVLYRCNCLDSEFANIIEKIKMPGIKYEEKYSLLNDFRGEIYRSYPEIARMIEVHIPAELLRYTKNNFKNYHRSDSGEIIKKKYANELRMLLAVQEGNKFMIVKLEAASG
ncbi:MAG: hypothetical protein DKM50_06815 [Candidatus Margulisiibacteriota bacterium]|nr:MAG: hypothetical protein DKM50_06815 [Candidatus Margulisiibacteriota bacterium]HCY35674.1 hypothetical protein [Candidatus Margulisiibacteriota bacterium]